jgi:hypothetical protein
MFESRLCAHRARFGDVMIVEGESRKVGGVILPPSVWNALSQGTNVVLEASVERRVEVLCADYLTDEQSRAELRERLPHVEQRDARGRLAVARLDARWVGSTRLCGSRSRITTIRCTRTAKRGREHALRVDATDPACARAPCSPSPSRIETRGPAVIAGGSPRSHALRGSRALRRRSSG